MIDYMKDKEYNEDEDIKLFIITNKNIPIIATKSSDGINMNKVYNLNYYEKSYECKYHIDYLQVLLNKCFKNKELNNYIGITDNQKAEEIIKEIVNRNNVVLSNITPYNSMLYKINNEKYARLYINKLITREQIKILLENINLIKKFDYLEIIEYKDRKIINNKNINIKKIKEKNIEYKLKKELKK